MKRHGLRSPAGFTLSELMVVVSIFVIMVSVAVPVTLNVTEAMRLGGAAREFERELQSARLKAVQANRPLRVRLNCPAPGEYRRVEVMNADSDLATNRCSEVFYPFPSPRDSDPSTPAHDGGRRFLPPGVAIEVGAEAIEFRPDGRAFSVTAGAVQAIGSTGVSFTLRKGTHSARVNVNGLGRVEIE